MNKIFCPLTKGETTRLVDNLETMYSVFFGRITHFRATEIQTFINAKNLINSILLKSTERIEVDEPLEGGTDEKGN